MTAHCDDPYPLGVLRALIVERVHEFLGQVSAPQGGPGCGYISPFADHAVGDISALIGARVPDSGPVRCPRGCGRAWHAMAVTVDVEVMSIRGEPAADYHSSGDGSTVLCPGPEFVGPPGPPRMTCRECGQLRAAKDEYLCQVLIEALVQLERLLDEVEQIADGYAARACTADQAACGCARHRATRALDRFHRA